MAIDIPRGCISRDPFKARAYLACALYDFLDIDGYAVSDDGVTIEAVFDSLGNLDGIHSAVCYLQSCISAEWYADTARLIRSALWEYRTRLIRLHLL